MDPQTAIQITTHFAAMLLGVVIAHWLRVSGDRRREYNELADQIFETANTTLDSSAGPWFCFDRSAVMQIRRRMGPLQRWRFDRAIAEFERASAETWQNECGEELFSEVDNVNRALRKIAKSVPRR